MFAFSWIFSIFFFQTFMKHAKGREVKKHWQENLEQTDPVEGNITQEHKYSKASALPSSVRRAGEAM